MNGPKRQEYCAANGIPFDAVVYANPIWGLNQGPVPKEKDWDVHIGTRIDMPPGAANIQYAVPPNAQVVGPGMVGGPYVVPPSAHPYVPQAPLAAHPYGPQAPPTANPYVHQAPPAAYPYAPQAPPTANPYYPQAPPAGMEPPPYSEVENPKS